MATRQSASVTSTLGTDLGPSCPRTTPEAKNSRVRSSKFLRRSRSFPEVRSTMAKQSGELHVMVKWETATAPETTSGYGAEMINPGDIVGGFFVQEGRCFRMVASLSGQKGQTTHCCEPVVW
jgi:hypothetical protein